MAQKITKFLISILILVGLVFMVFNFIPQSKASPGLWGTTQWVTHPEEWMEPYHIGLGWYCLDDPSTCVIVP